MRFKITLLMLTACCLSVMAAEEPKGSISVIAGGNSVSGEESLFRAHHWSSDGFEGGIESLTYNADGLSLEASAILGKNDYNLLLQKSLSDGYYLKFGFQNYQKWFDDFGGYYRGMNPNSYSLDTDLDMSIGKIFLEWGRKVDDAPSWLLAYEYRYRDGTRSILGWNAAKQGGTTKYIHPSTKEIDEKVHIIRAEASHDFDGFVVEDKLRYEIYQNDTTRSDISPAAVAGTRSDSGHPENEEFDHQQLMNALTVEKWMNDWLFVSAGYLLVEHQGDTDFDLATQPAGGAHDKFYTIKKSDLDLQSHVLSLGSFMAPTPDLTVSIGVQGEYSETKTYGDVYHSHHAGTPDPADEQIINNDIDELSLEETVEVRYFGLPACTIYAEGHFRQGYWNHEEEAVQAISGHDELLRDTDVAETAARGDAGITYSPNRYFTLNTYYRIKTTDSDYDADQDSEGEGTVGEGYSAFIKMLETRRDELGVKVTYRPAGWLKTSLRYRMIDSDRQSRTEPVVSLGFPGGELTAMDYIANDYSLNTVIAPSSKFFVTATVSVRDTTTKVPGLDAPNTLADYNGDVISGMIAANCICSENTDLRFMYSIAEVNNDQKNTKGLPTASDYTAQSFSATARRKLTETVSCKVQYILDQYDDSDYETYGDTYTAHGIFGGITKVF